MRKYARYRAADTAKRACQFQNIEVGNLKVQGSGRSPSPIIQTADIKSVADLFELVKKYARSFRPKETSKVVNADGRPRVGKLFMTSVCAGAAA